jgi:hypothetical protein
MVSTRLLTESTAGNCHDSCLFEHFHAVHKVGLLFLFFGMSQEFVAKVHSGESVHGSFNFLAGDVFHFIKSMFQKLCTFDKTLFDMALL